MGLLYAKPWKGHLEDMAGVSGVLVLGRLNKASGRLWQSCVCNLAVTCNMCFKDLSWQLVRLYWGISALRSATVSGRNLVVLCIMNAINLKPSLELAPWAILFNG
jgi:hypothetical protein